MKKVNKKAQAFETINKGMVAFVAFVLIVLLTVLLVSTTKTTSIVCPGTIRTGNCLSCSTGFGINTTGEVCCNSTGGTDHCTGANQTPAIFGNDAYNATEDLQEAAGLPPQFAQIIVIVIIIVGILSMLAILGYGVYNRMRK